MKILANLYNTVLKWSKYPNAPRYLAFVSFIDSSIFPISPLFMLLPMSFATPERAFWFATITSVSSILGGIVGYALGFFAFEAFMEPLLIWSGYMPSYESALTWFNRYGFWTILIGSFTPFIPFKIFSIGAGVLQIKFLGFLGASILGRCLRFFFIAAVIRILGPKVEPFIRKLFSVHE